MLQLLTEGRRHRILREKQLIEARADRDAVCVSKRFGPCLGGNSRRGRGRGRRAYRRGGVERKFPVPTVAVRVVATV